jgi:hypothetical protein
MVPGAAGLPDVEKLRAQLQDAEDRMRVEPARQVWLWLVGVGS